MLQRFGLRLYPTGAHQHYQVPLDWPTQDGGDRSFGATMAPPPGPIASATVPTQVGPGKRLSWADQTDEEEDREAAQHAATASSSAAPAEDWIDFQDLTLGDLTPTFLPQPPVYNDVRLAPHRLSEHHICEATMFEPEPPSTEHLPDAATPSALPLVRADQAEVVIHAFEPRGMSSFDNPYILEDDRPDVYCLACYRQVRLLQWNFCPSCKHGDTAVPVVDPLVLRCVGAQRLDDKTVVLGHALMLEVGQRITSSVMARMVKLEPSPAALPFRLVGLTEDQGVWPTETRLQTSTQLYCWLLQSTP